MPDLSAEDKKVIDDYWEQYGIKLPDYSWHRMYYHVTGIHSPKFIPQPVAELIIYEYYNDKGYHDAWGDKNMYDRFLPDVPFPNTILKCIRGRYFVCGKYYSKSDISIAAKRLLDYTTEHKCDVIIKVARDTGAGRGVKKYHISTIEEAAKVLGKWENCQHFIVQECVKQHVLLARFNKSSTNMIRICSWRHDDVVEILYATARAGVEGAVTDVSFINGEEKLFVVGITPDGYFSDQMLDQDGVKVKDLEKGVKLPGWEQIISIIKQNHLLIDNFDLIGWDFTVDVSGNPVCFEYNIKSPGTMLYQYTNGPLFGDKTESILAFLKDEKNQYNYVPCYMRKK